MENIIAILFLYIMKVRLLFIIFQLMNRRKFILTSSCGNINDSTPKNIMQILFTEELYFSICILFNYQLTTIQSLCGFSQPEHFFHFIEFSFLYSFEQTHCFSSIHFSVSNSHLNSVRKTLM